MSRRLANSFRGVEFFLRRLILIIMFLFVTYQFALPVLSTPRSRVTSLSFTLPLLLPDPGLSFVQERINFEVSMSYLSMRGC